MVKVFKQIKINIVRKFYLLQKFMHTVSPSGTGLQSPQVRWRRPGGLPLPPGHSVTGGTLYIPSISKEYDGEYQCVVASERGDFSATVILIVSG